MMYSKEFLGEVLAASDAGGGTKDVAIRFNASESWVRRIKQQRHEHGKVALKTTHDRNPKWPPFGDWLREIVANQPDMYLHEIQAALKAEHNFDIAESTLWTACRALKLTRKKKRR